LVTNSVKKIVCSLCFVCGVVATTHAQNLFANPGFEAINNCTEYKADCAPEAWFNIPAGNFLVNGRKAVRALLGDMVLIIPAGNVMANFNKPRYVYTALCCPLVKDKKYKLSFYIHTSTVSFNSLAVYFTNKEPSLSTTGNLAANPSVIINKEHLAEMPDSKWNFVSHSFIATGSERYFIFTTKGLPQPEYEMKDAMNKSGDVLYFIDEIDLQAEEPMALCEAYKKNEEQLFAYNYRHSDNLPVFVEEKQLPPAPKFINDTIIIPGLLFDVNKAVVKMEAAKILDSISISLQQKGFVQIAVTGHTDSTGNEAANQLLSAARAESIKNYLAQKLPVEKITSAGKAAAMPASSNSTATGRQRNRRVEIIITYFKKLQ
jgi:outer membrane protein OmpA-like peptidoglycan-associated protein